MDYLQQLKALKREKKTEKPLEHTLQNLRNPEKGSFVGFVASPLGVSANFSAENQTDTDGNDPPPVSPSAPSVLGTKQTSVYAGVPSVPHVPSKKTSNPNEAAKTQAWGKMQTARLIHAAMLACDYWQDGEAARAEMQQQCQDATPAEQQELLRYFQQAYRGWGKSRQKSFRYFHTPPYGAGNSSAPMLH